MLLTNLSFDLNPIFRFTFKHNFSIAVPAPQIAIFFPNVHTRAGRDTKGDRAQSFEVNFPHPLKYIENKFTVQYVNKLADPGLSPHFCVLALYMVPTPKVRMSGVTHIHHKYAVQCKLVIPTPFFLFLRSLRLSNDMCKSSYAK